MAKSDFNIEQAANEMGVDSNDLENRIDLLELRAGIETKNIQKAIENDYRTILKKKGLEDYLCIVEKNAIKTALEKSDGDKNAAADLLGITYRSFRYRTDKLFDNSDTKSTITNDYMLVDYFQSFSQMAPLDQFISFVEEKMLCLALEEANFLKTQAADLLGITFRSFRYKLKTIDIELAIKNQI